MPLYEFECAKCKTTFTEKETFEEHARHRKVKCPKCGSTNVPGLVRAVGVKTSKKS
jgi:putative FmdB family regulatory protein